MNDSVLTKTQMLLLAGSLLLAGCTPPTGQMPPPQAAQRIELFKDCMAALPAGPEATKYNDWDEVVMACDKVASAQSTGTKYWYIQ